MQPFFARQVEVGQYMSIQYYQTRLTGFFEHPVTNNSVTNYPAVVIISDLFDFIEHCDQPDISPR